MVKQGRSPRGPCNISPRAFLRRAFREAESVLLNRRYFALPEEEFRRFTDLLDKPPAGNPRLARLLKTKAPWDK